VTQRRVDVVSIVAGVAVAALGVLLLLDQADVIDLRFDYAAPAVFATVGVVLLALGLDPRPRRHAGPWRGAAAPASGTPPTGDMAPAAADVPTTADDVASAAADGPAPRDD
jgi:hypothetical protein